MISCFSNLKMCENHLWVLRFLSLTLRDCDLAGLKGGPGICISNKHPEAEAAELKSTEMFVEGFQAKLKKDTSYRGLWTVSFILKEF